MRATYSISAAVCPSAQLPGKRKLKKKALFKRSDKLSVTVVNEPSSSTLGLICCSVQSTSGYLSSNIGIEDGSYCPDLLSYVFKSKAMPFSTRNELLR